MELRTVCFRRGKMDRLICVKYFRQYGEAPSKRIESLFGEEAKGRDGDDATVQRVSGILSHLSDLDVHQSPASTEYLTDLAQQFSTASSFNGSVTLSIRKPIARRSMIL